MDAATQIRTARLTERLTQRELARRAGTTQSAVAAYESGARRPSSDTLARLLDTSGFLPSHLLRQHRQEVNAIVERFRGRNTRVFGSIARNEDTPTSDIDLLVRFERGTSLVDLITLEQELVALLGIDVDVVSEGGLRLPKHQAILDEARPL